MKGRRTTFCCAKSHYADGAQLPLRGRSGAAASRPILTLMVMEKDKTDKTVGPWTLHEKVGLGARPHHMGSCTPDRRHQALAALLDRGKRRSE
jgi:hypothetical protein